MASLGTKPFKNAVPVDERLLQVKEKDGVEDGDTKSAERKSALNHEVALFRCGRCSRIGVGMGDFR